jgi:hypothetical protein
MKIEMVRNASTIGCYECGKTGKVAVLYIQGIRVICPLVLCPTCIATLHSITSPLSVLVQTGIDTGKKEL